MMLSTTAMLENNMWGAVPAWLLAFDKGFNTLQKWHLRVICLSIPHIISQTFSTLAFVHNRS